MNKLPFSVEEIQMFSAPDNEVLESIVLVVLTAVLIFGYCLVF